MKKAIFKRLDGSEICHRIEEDPTAYIEHCAQTNHWGKASRWVRAKLPAGDSFTYPDEVYAEEDIIEWRTDIIMSESINMVHLRGDYTVTIVDLDVDPTYLLEQCHKNRRAAYPPLSEFADAFVKLQGGDSTQMTAYVAACNAVKTQFPKP